MLDLGLGELLVIGALVLIFVGPEQLPHATRTLGRAYGKMRRAADELRRALVLEADRLDEEERLRELRRRREARERQEAQEQMSERHGSRAQPEGHRPPAGGDEAPDQADGVPEGFTEAEWLELPPHIREIVLRRRTSA